MNKLLYTLPKPKLPTVLKPPATGSPAPNHTPPSPPTPRQRRLGPRHWHLPRRGQRANAAAAGLVGRVTKDGKTPANAHACGCLAASAINTSFYCASSDASRHAASNRGRNPNTLLHHLAKQPEVCIRPEDYTQSRRSPCGPWRKVPSGLLFSAGRGQHRARKDLQAGAERCGEGAEKAKTLEKRSQNVKWI